MSGQREPVLIAGAGIGGLTLALALARKGISSIILERETRLEEVGAGIQISPNAAHVLLALGLEQELRKVAGVPVQIQIANGQSGKILARLPLGDVIAARYGAPYFVIHRADLQKVLLDAVQGEPLVSLHLGEGIQSYEQDGETVSAITATNRHSGSLLVGADGVRSQVRQQLAGDGPPAFSGFVAWRGVCDAAKVDEAHLRSTGLWLGPAAHLVHYPIRRGAALNVVAIVEEPVTPNEHISGDSVLRHYLGWCAAALDVLGAVTDWKRWPLFHRPPLANWCDGRVTLLGDAVHPMLPFLAQGGAMAIEDAAVLSSALEQMTDVPNALTLYARQRQPRTARAQTEAHSNGRIYHLPRLVSPIRDLALRARSAEGLADRQDWIYRWRPTG